MQMAPKTLVKTQEPVDSDGRQQKWNRESRGINGQQKHAARNCFRIGGERQDRGENRTNARRPPKSKCEAQKEPTGDSGKRATSFGAFRVLRAEIVEADIAIEPASERGAGKKNQSNRKQLHGAKNPSGTHRVSP